MTITFLRRTYGAELVGVTTLNGAPIIRLWADYNKHTATNEHAARLWLCDNGLKRSKAKKLLAAVIRGEETASAVLHHGEP